MARKRASMREGPLAELFRATEAAQRQQEPGETPAPSAGELEVLRSLHARTAAAHGSDA